MKIKRSPSLILFWATLCILFTAFSFSSYSLFVPEFLKEFPWTRAEVSLPFSLAMIVWGAVQPFTGMLADAKGTRPVILGGVVLTGLGFIVVGVAQDLWIISLGFGLLIGVAISAAGSVSFALLISKWFTGVRRGSAVGVVQAATPASPMLLAPIMFYAMVTFGWRSASLGFGLFLLCVTLPIAYFTLHDPETKSGASSGAGEQYGWREVWLVVKHPPMRNLFVARFACGISFLLIPALAAAAIEAGLSPAEGAIAVTLFGASSTIGSIAGGFASDRWGRVNMLVATYIIRGLGALAMAVVSMDALWFYMAVVLAGGPIFATVAINNVQAFEMVGGKSAGLILGLGIVLHQVAAGIAPYVSGMLFDSMNTYRISFLGLGVILLLAAIPAARTKAVPVDFKRVVPVPSMGTE